jgi:hypothetical protein
VKKQKIFDLEQVLSENEAKKVFNTLLTTEQKPNESNASNEEKFGRNKKIQITTYLCLTSSNKKKNQYKEI